MVRSYSKTNGNSDMYGTSILHLTTLKDWSEADVLRTVERSIDIKRNPRHYSAALSGKTLALLFQKTSTRTRCAGEIGMTQLGGHALYLDWRNTNFGLADLGDEVRVLSSYADFIVARLMQHDDVLRAAEASTAPIMNGCCNRYHPLQGLTDLMTVHEALGRLEGVRLTYVGVLNNVANSLIAAGLKTGMHVTCICPEVNPAARDEALYSEASAAGLYEYGAEAEQLQDVLAQSDVVYTDTWIDMEFFTDPAFAEEKERRIALFQPFQINADLVRNLDLKILHCLPAHHGYEITGDMLHDPRSLIFTQAENRLHSQKAVLLQLANAPE
jgi:ornithine carbamoyltransferase